LIHLSSSFSFFALFTCCSMLASRLCTFSSETCYLSFHLLTSASNSLIWSGKLEGFSMKTTSIVLFVLPHNVKLPDYQVSVGRKMLFLVTPLHPLYHFEKRKSSDRITELFKVSKMSFVYIA
jgi:hypothetical protein